MEIKDKVVIITGSASGIGESAAYLFAKNGAKVVVNSKSNTKGGEETVENIKKHGGQAIYIGVDVSNPKEAKTLVEKTIKEFGRLDVLINNAGKYESLDYLTATKESWLKTLDNNLFSAVFCSQYAAKEMLKQGFGKIINTSSVYGLEHTGDETGMAYSVAKAGIVSLTKNLAKLWAPKILVNAVAPGYVHIPKFDSYPREELERMQSEMKLGRWIKTDEIADAYLFLAKNDALTGEVLVVDAGFTLKG